MPEKTPSPRRAAYLRTVRREKRRVRIWQIALVAGLFAVWELSCRLGLSDGFLVSSPSRIAATFLSLCRSGDVLLHVGVSCWETAVGFLLGTNIGEVIVVFLAMVLWHKAPLLSMQLLWVNLVTDSLPAIALGMEPVERDVMERKPKPKKEGLFAHGFGLRIALQGVMFGALSLAAFYIGEAETGLVAGGQTLAFMVLALSQVVQAFNMRSDRSIFRIGPFGNRSLNGAALVSVALVALVLFTPLSIPFGLIALPGKLYGIGLALIFVPVLVMELSKACGLIRHQHT